MALPVASSAATDLAGLCDFPFYEDNIDAKKVDI